MARTDRAISDPDVATLERLRQVTSRIRARARGDAPDPAALPRRAPAPAARSHWSDGPREDDELDDG